MMQGALRQWRGPGLRWYLIRGAAGSFALRVTGTGLTLATSVLLARVLGAQGYGVYAYVFSIVSLLAVPAALGLPNLIIRYVAMYEARGEWGLLRGLLRRANQATLAAACGLAIIAAFIGWLARGWLAPEALATFWLALALLPLSVLSRLRLAALQGLRHVVLSQVPESLVRPGLFFLLAGGAYLALGEERFSPPWAMTMLAAATSAAFLLGTALILGRLPVAVRRDNPVYLHRTWAAGALPLLAMGSMGFINSYTDILMLGAIHGAAAAGVYQVAVQGAVLVSFVLVAANMALAPAIARLHESGDLSQLQRVATGSARAILLWSAPLALLFILGGGTVLRTVFGVEFGAGATALAILSAGQLVNAGMGSVGVILMMTGHERDAALGVGVAAAMNVSLNALFIPLWGIDGAAAATSTSLVTWNLLLAWRLYHHTGIHSTALGKLR
jgi:O-antigen/teichoic acid export membrane protein